jgi:CRP-like cAMP-binding protein
MVKDRPARIVIVGGGFGGVYTAIALEKLLGHGPEAIVVDGQVEVLRRVPGQGDVALRTLGPGECFGEIALGGESARTATVRSRSSVNVLAVDRDAFQALFTNLPPLRGFFEQLIAMRRQ